MVVNVSSSHVYKFSLLILSKAYTTHSMLNYVDSFTYFESIQVERESFPHDFSSPHLRMEMRERDKESRRSALSVSRGWGQQVVRLNFLRDLQVNNSDEWLLINILLLHFPFLFSTWYKVVSYFSLCSSKAKCLFLHSLLLKRMEFYHLYVFFLFQDCG